MYNVRAQSVILVFQSNVIGNAISGQISIIQSLLSI